MDGYPYDSHNPGRGQPQEYGQLSAQMRAALGLTGSSFEEALYLQQQQRQQDLQRERLRQLLLQEQFGQQGNYESLLQGRGMGDHLQDYPDIQQHYHGLLLREQLQRQEESSILEQLRYQEELRRHQMQTHRQDAYAAPPAHPQELAHAQDFAEARARAQQAQDFAEARARAEAQAQEQTQSKTEADSQTQSDMARLRDLAADSLAGNAVKKSEIDRKRPAPDEADSIEFDDVVQEPPTKKPAKEAKEKEKPPKSKRGPKAKKKLEEDQVLSAAKFSPAPKDSKKPKKVAKKNAKLNGKESGKGKKSPKSPKRPKQGSTASGWNSQSLASDYPAQAGYVQSFLRGPSMPVLEDDAKRSGLMPAPATRLGTVTGLLQAAEEDDGVNNAVGALHAFQGVTPTDLVNDVPEEPKIPLNKKVSIRLPNGFSSELPLLPEEPLWEGEIPSRASSTAQVASILHASENGSADKDDQVAMEIEHGKAKTFKVSNVLDYPYPIDVWWPSMEGIKQERKDKGYASDEDDFKEAPSPDNEQPPLRANLPAIKARLSQELRPGVLEKMPHCKVHRILMKKKKSFSAPELVYCWQVTDIYPNHLMVCCSVCGTWRHAECGGHHKPYSVRENTEEPFVAVCDRCHEEEKILCDYPIAQNRIEKQRMEQLRRGLATTAVMRHASFSKHSGTYKWPIGRVTPTQFGGHTRSVHSRHDKAEKQWADMASRLARGYGYRPRERARVRTKELERLLVSVEDAEAYTDRHNIFLFLMRDTMREQPVGFENERNNLFDPEEDELAIPHITEGKTETNDSDDNPSSSDMKSSDPAILRGNGDESTGKEANDKKPDAEETEHGKEVQQSKCARAGCVNRPRFDSMFCSDSCGVSALELDLLRSFQEGGDIHPSILRN